MSFVQSKKLVLGALVAAVPIIGSASGLDRGVVPPDYLYEQGDFMQFSAAVVQPDVKGKVVSSPKAALQAIAPSVADAVPEVGASTGSIANDHVRWGMSLKKEINEDFSFGVSLTQPSGVDVAYSDAVFGIKFDTEVMATDIVLKYQINDALSVFGGPRVQQNSNGGFNNNLNGEFRYNGTTETGYVFGAGYKNPDYMTQLLVSYTSDIKHTMTAHPVAGSGPVADGVIASDYPGEIYLNTPDHLQVVVKQPISTESAIFASYRKSGWSQANVETNLPGFEQLSNFKDVEAYTLGYGRKVTENVSLLGSLLHQTGEANLFGPVNNRTGATLMARFDMDKVRVESGLVYYKLEDAETTISLGSAGDVDLKFEDNSALAYTFRFGYYF